MVDVAPPPFIFLTIRVKVHVYSVRRERITSLGMKDRDRVAKAADCGGEGHSWPARTTQREG